MLQSIGAPLTFPELRDSISKYLPGGEPCLEVVVFSEKLPLATDRICLCQQLGLNFSHPLQNQFVPRELVYADGAISMQLRTAVQKESTVEIRKPTEADVIKAFDNVTGRAPQLSDII